MEQTLLANNHHYKESQNIVVSDGKAPLTRTTSVGIRQDSSAILPSTAFPVDVRQAVLIPGMAADQPFSRQLPPPFTAASTRVMGMCVHPALDALE